MVQNTLIDRLLTLLVVVTTCHGETNHIRRRDTSESWADAGRPLESNETHESKKSSLTLLNEIRISEKDPGLHRKPQSMMEKTQIFNEAIAEKTQANENGRNSRSKSHSSLNSIHDKAMKVGQHEKDDGRRVLEVHDQVADTRGCKGVKKIVQCKDDVPEEVCKQDLLDLGVEVVSDMPNTVFFAICIDSEEKVQLVAEHADVAGVEEDPPRTLSYFPGSEVVRHLQNNGQVTPYGVELVKAPDFWARYGKRGEGVKVCVIDTGLRVTHEDIQDADVDGTDASNLVTPWSDDGNSHGTHVTGTIAASDNDVGVVGVAPDASIHVIRAFDSSGQFSASSLVGAMQACANAGSQIISMSLGGPIETFAEQSIVRTLEGAGILLIAASGNDASGLNLVEYPAGYDGVTSVGAVNEDFQIASFSTHNTAVDVSGPGVDVLSMTASNDRSYSEFSGTSMAAPHVAGVAALLWSQFPNKSVGEIRSALENSARDVGACGKDRLFGHGVVDAMAAAALLENGGSAAPELNGCISTTVELTTDDYGAETTYVITPTDDTNNFVYRGGPYPSNRRSTYTDNFQLQDRCYNLFLLDSYGDGSNNPQYGRGSISLLYDGNNQVEFNEFAGARASFQFGNCGNGGGGNNNNPNPTSAPVTPTSSPVSPTSAPFSPTLAPINPTPSPISPTSAPVSRPTDQPVGGSPTAGCPSGCSLLALSLETDRWSRAENHLYLFEDPTPEDDWLWKTELYHLQGSSEYAGNACLSPTKCYKFFFFDEWGDGFSSGGLTLTLDGTTVLEISPGENGTIFESGKASTFWYQQFGPCSTTSSANGNQ